MAGIGLDWMGNPAAPPPATAESEEGEPAEEVEPSPSAPPTIAQIAEEHEERPAEEITEGFGRRTAPEGVKVYNPAFDVTPARLVTGIVTEHGVIESPDQERVEAALRAAGVDLEG